MVAALAIAATTAGMVAAAPANAILLFKLNTTTTLTVTPGVATEGVPVTLNAAVKISTVNSLGVTPTGTVTFTAKNAMGASYTIGTAPLKECFLIPCRAILTSSTIPVGTVKAFAKYNGDSHTNTSTGSTPLTINANPNPGSSAEVTCYPGQTCDTGELTSTANDSDTHFEVNSPGGGSSQTITASLDEGTLHCVEPLQNDGDGDDDDGVFVGALASFEVSGGTGTKLITYTGYGQTGQIMKHQLLEHPSHAGCWGSPVPFYGFTNGHYGLAPFVEEDGLYVAMLPLCQYINNKQPCMTGIGAGDGSWYAYRVKTPATAGDPKIIG
jgi:hypothetical protein